MTPGEHKIRGEIAHFSVFQKSFLEFPTKSIKKIDKKHEIMWVYK